jgi:hypothetical protein
MNNLEITFLFALVGMIIATRMLRNKLIFKRTKI